MAARGPKSDKLWSDAVRLAAMREEDDGTGKKRRRLSIIADNLCRAAMAGDIQAIKEVGDRIDGKPKQATEISGDKDAPLVHRIERTIVKAANKDG